jgi:hypothetical protein
MFSRKNVIAVVAVLVLIPLAAVAWWLGSPLLMNTTVEEEFPFAFAATVPPDMTMAGVEQVMAGMAKVDQEVNEPMPDVIGDAVPEAMIDAMMDAVPQTVVDAMAQASIEAMPGDMTEAMKKEMALAIPEAMKGALSNAMKDAMVQTMPDAMKGAEMTQLSPVKLKAGDFSGVDRFHKGSGKATIYSSPGGSHLLRLEDFKVTNGPDLRVILTPVQDPGGPDDVTAPGHVELAKLKGNMGNQNYEIPNDVDVASFQSVVIYCSPFRVIFSVAPLQDIS